MAAPLTVANLLAPRLRPQYEAVAALAADALGRPLEFVEDARGKQLLEGSVELAFVCGLPYVGLRARGDVEALAALVVALPRYAGRPVYFSDLVVTSERAGAGLKALRSLRLAYNETGSYSGYVALVAELAARELSAPFFGSAVATGSHEGSLGAVRDGGADVAAIDSQLLDRIRADAPHELDGLAVAASIGPAPAPPLVAGAALSSPDRTAVRAAVTSPASKSVGRWSAVDDGYYDEIRGRAAAARVRAIG